MTKATTSRGAWLPLGLPQLFLRRIFSEASHVTRVGTRKPLYPPGTLSAWSSSQAASVNTSGRRPHIHRGPGSLSSSSPSSISIPMRMELTEPYSRQGVTRAKDPSLLSSRPLPTHPLHCSRSCYCFLGSPSQQRGTPHTILHLCIVAEKSNDLN